MLRLLFFAVVLLVLVAAGAAIVRSVRSSNIDWTGVAFAVGFVALAIYLHQVTGIGWL